MSTSKIDYQPTKDINGVEHFDPFCDFMRTHILLIGGWPGRFLMMERFSEHFGVDEETAFFMIDNRITVNFANKGMTLYNMALTEKESAIYERFKANELLGKESGTGKEGEMA